MNLTNIFDDDFMRQALIQAEEAQRQKEIPVGAIIVCKNKIIARDHNRCNHLKDATAHAELLAVTAAQNYLNSRYLNECTMYVTLEPCCMCAGALFWTQLGKLVIGALDKKRGYSIFNHKIIHPKTKTVTHILSNECEEIIKEYFKKMRIK